jgi:hypothetical protein
VAYIGQVTLTHKNMWCGRGVTLIYGITLNACMWQRSKSELTDNDYKKLLALLRSPYSTIFEHRMLLFDLGGTIASVCMFANVILLTVRHTAQLYREEPLA